jgi:hypothetical protein
MIGSTIVQNANGTASLVHPVYGVVHTVGGSNAATLLQQAYPTATVSGAAPASTITVSGTATPTITAAPPPPPSSSVFLSGLTPQQQTAALQMGPPSPAATSTPTTNTQSLAARETQLINAYRTAFNRDPDPQGLAFYLTGGGKDLPISNVVDIFKQSPEYAQRFPATATAESANVPAGQSRIDPRLQPFLMRGLEQAERLFFGPQPEFYPGQTYVSPSEQTLTALAQQEAIARGAQPALAAAQNAYTSGMGGLQRTASGEFLSGSPFLTAAIQGATRPISQQFTEQTLPGLQSAFSAAGRYGSGAQTQAISRAQEAASRAIGDVSAQMSLADYGRERGFQNQAFGAQIQGAQFAPQLFAQQFLPSQQLGQIGAAREQIAAQPLQEAIDRFQFQQQAPYSQLQGFLSSVYGTPMSQSNIPQQQQQTNRIGSTIGGALLGSQVGNLFGGFGGFTGGQIGAGLGALGGLLL